MEFESSLRKKKIDFEDQDQRSRKEVWQNLLCTVDGTISSFESKYFPTVYKISVHILFYPNTSLVFKRGEVLGTTQLLG